MSRFPIRSTNRVRGVALAGVVVLAGSAVPLVASDISAASPAAKPAAGTIHLYVINTGLTPTAHNKVLITGAISDHGSGKNGTLHLVKGTITADISKLKAATSSSSFGTFYPKSCSADGVATARVAVVSGTGAYSGIHGSLVATETYAAEGSRLPNGKCNQSDNAPAVAQDLIVTASGRVSL